VETMLDARLPYVAMISMISMIRRFAHFRWPVAAAKPVAAICQGSALLFFTLAVRLAGDATRLHLHHPMEMASCAVAVPWLNQS